MGNEREFERFKEFLQGPHAKFSFRVVLPAKFMQHIQAAVMVQEPTDIPHLVWIRKMLMNGVLKAKYDFDLTEEESVTFLAGLFSILSTVTGPFEKVRNWRTWFWAGLIGGIIGSVAVNVILIWRPFG